MKLFVPTLLGLLSAATAFADKPQFLIEARYVGFTSGQASERVLAAPRVLVTAGQSATIESGSEVALPGAPVIVPAATVIAAAGPELVKAPKARETKVRYELDTTGDRYKIVQKSVDLPLEAPVAEPPRAPVKLPVEEPARPVLREPSKKSVSCGMKLEISAELKEGRIVISGRSVVRRALSASGNKPGLNAQSFSTRETYFNDEIAEGKPVTILAGDGAQDKSRIVLTVTRVQAAR